MGLHETYGHVGYVILPDGREVHVEVTERGNVRSNLVYDEPPKGLSAFAWGGMESRAMPRALWRADGLRALKEAIKTVDVDVGGSLRGYFRASFADLVALLGPPNADGDGQEVSTAWNVEFGGEHYHIYDYKQTNLYREGLPSVTEFRNLPAYSWHVGGEKDANALLNALNRVFQ